MRQVGDCGIEAVRDDSLQRLVIGLVAEQADVGRIDGVEQGFALAAAVPYPPLGQGVAPAARVDDHVDVVVQHQTIERLAFRGAGFTNLRGVECDGFVTQLPRRLCNAGQVVLKKGSGSDVGLAQQQEAHAVLLQNVRGGRNDSKN